MTIRGDWVRPVIITIDIPTEGENFGHLLNYPFSKDLISCLARLNEYSNVTTSDRSIVGDFLQNQFRAQRQATILLAHTDHRRP